MKFVRKVVNSDILANIIDIPEDLRNKKVEIIILSYENMDEDYIKQRRNKKVKGALAEYKNKELREKEDSAWASAVVNKYENS